MLLVLIFPLAILIPDALGATMTAFIDPWDQKGVITLTYLQSYIIRHDGQGNLASALEDQDWRIESMFDSTEPGVIALNEKINSAIFSERSQVTVSDIDVKYTASLTSREKSSDIDYKVIIKGKLDNYIIKDEDAVNPGIIDMGWRYFDIKGPIIIDGFDINNPLAALELESPEAYDLLYGTTGGQLLETELLHENSFYTPLDVWHYLFDPTGINVDANRFGLSDKISDKVVSKYTLGESGLREGRKTDEIVNVPFSLDRDYYMRTINTIDIAELAVVGHTSISSLDDLETLGFSVSPIGTTTSTGGFPAHIVIGMAVMAAIGGGVFLIISNRQLKKDAGATQTGIDPSQLRAYSTSDASGGYKTNRGEAQLRDDYDSGSSQTPEIPDSKPGAMPKGWKKD